LKRTTRRCTEERVRSLLRTTQSRSSESSVIFKASCFGYFKGCDKQLRMIVCCVKAVFVSCVLMCVVQVVLNCCKTQSFVF
jgi:hypothetical protein